MNVRLCVMSAGSRGDNLVAVGLLDRRAFSSDDGPAKLGKLPSNSRTPSIQKQNGKIGQRSNILCTTVRGTQAKLGRSRWRQYYQKNERYPGSGNPFCGKHATTCGGPNQFEYSILSPLCAHFTTFKFASFVHASFARMVVRRLSEGKDRDEG